MPPRPAPRAPKGTGDVLAPESERWQHVLATFGGVAGAAGFGRFRSPVVEDADVVRRAGEDEVVAVTGGEASAPSLALAGGQASALRAFAQHELATPWKVWWSGPRLEAGPDHLHQHHEMGVEALGSPDPDLDVEVMAVGHDVLRALGLRHSTLVLNSVGTPADRERYVATLRDWLAARSGDLADEDRRRVTTDPLGVLGSTQPTTRAVVADAPHATDSLSAEGVTHLERVQDGLGAAGIAYLLDHRLAGPSGHGVHTVFELQADDLPVGAAPLFRGERHLGLVEGGPGAAVPLGAGLSGDVERLLDALEAEGATTSVGDVLETSEPGRRRPRR